MHLTNESIDQSLRRFSIYGDSMKIQIKNKDRTSLQLTRSFYVRFKSAKCYVKWILQVMDSLLLYFSCFHVPLLLLTTYLYRSINLKIISALPELRTWGIKGSCWRCCCSSSRLRSSWCCPCCWRWCSWWYTWCACSLYASSDSGAACASALDTCGSSIGSGPPLRRGVFTPPKNASPLTAFPCANTPVAWPPLLERRTGL